MYNMNPTTYVYVHIKHCVFYNLYNLYFFIRIDLVVSVIVVQLFLSLLLLISLHMGDL